MKPRGLEVLFFNFFIVQKNDAEHAEKFQSERKKVKEMNKIDYLFIVAH